MAPHALIFEFEDATYELRLNPSSSRDFELILSRIGSPQP